MVKNGPLVEQFEREQIKAQKPHFLKNLAIYESLYQEAVLLGVFPLKDPLEGIEKDLLLAKALHVCQTPR